MYKYTHKPADTYAIYKMCVTHDRMEFLHTRLGHKIEILETDDEFTTFELRVESSLDILAVFHSGVDYGIKKCPFK
jgi:hypothetical protein